jgi:glyoxylase-like metal-dependent hydrolase (beta-lactamase superfamily II)
LKNGVFFVGDALFTPEVTEKHKILYLYDAGKAYKSLDVIADADYDTAVLCHYGIYTKDEVAAFIVAQREHMEMIRAYLLGFTENIDAEAICAKLATKLDVALNAASWYLALSTVKGYLAWMQADGLVAASYEHGLRWSR